MKKVMLVLLMFCIVGCKGPSPTTYKKAEVIDRVTGVQPITYEQLQEKMEKSVDFLLYIGRPDCGDCKEFDPIMEEYFENKEYGIYYLNIKDFRDASKKEDATQEEKDFYENLQKTLSITWVPSLQRWIDGELVSSYQYLNLEYYSLSSQEEKDKEKESYIEKFKDWFEEHYD